MIYNPEIQIMIEQNVRKKKDLMLTREKTET